MRYGLPYKGSKNKIAEWIIDNLPSTEHFYDLFAGGCAVTHCALLSGKYKDCLANDITDSTSLFLNAIHGKYKNESRWISREEFARLKEKDTYIRICWSFGNDNKTYLYGKNIEEYKRVLWNAIFFGDCQDIEQKFGFDCSLIKTAQSKEDRFRKWREILKEDERIEKRGSAYYFKSGEISQSLQRLQSLERLERLEVVTGSYNEVQIKPNSVVYCDIPYRNCTGYLKDFDHSAFYDWAESQKELVVISEYDMPENRFARVAKIEKRQTMNGLGSGRKVEERLFVPISQVDLYNRLMAQSNAQTNFEF